MTGRGRKKPCACGCGELVKVANDYKRGHRPPAPIADRLWARVDKTDTCWLWRGYIAKDGYGRIGREGRPGMALTHRVAYEAAVGPIPEGLHLDHLCRVRHCLRPDHLEPVTCRENVRRGQMPGAVLMREDRCKSGLHRLSEHGYVTNSGKRVCGTCARDRARANRAMRKAAA